ncbi:hypothetical protein [Bradyrhizobium sp.]|uniref:hypothetical protein n=1 Tax=Bradyrhizobium sp. TaxID=376 RepID=UPI00261878B9|nr:hypothetical protein [Bradyrhizobium sp.]
MQWKAAALLVVLAGCAQQGGASAMAAGPKALAAFVGNWNGTWDGKLATTLVVESVTPPTARVIYEWGIATAWQVDNPGFIRGTARFFGDKLVLHLPSGATAVYVMQPDGTLAGTLAGPIAGPYAPQGGVVHATLARQ